MEVLQKYLQILIQALPIKKINGKAQDRTLDLDHGHKTSDYDALDCSATTAHLLGVTFDSKLNFSQQIANKINK